MSHRASMLFGWFPASWASNIAPCFLRDTGGSKMFPPGVSIGVSIVTGRGFNGEVLQAVGFIYRNTPRLACNPFVVFNTGCHHPISNGLDPRPMEQDCNTIPLRDWPVCLTLVSCLSVCLVTFLHSTSWHHRLRPRVGLCLLHYVLFVA